MIYKCRIILLLGSVLIWQSCKLGSENHPYLGPYLPKDKPQLFAPSIVNTDSIEINAVFNSTFTELFFTRIINEKFILHHAELIDGVWSAPKAIQMFKDQQSPSVAIDPSVSSDGKTLYFLGRSPEDHKNNRKPDIFSSKKINGKWQLAKKVNISTVDFAESYPVVVNDGSLYFESDRPGGFGKRDIYRSQYLGDDVFKLPKNLGSVINSEETARSTYVSPDEKYLIKANNSFDNKGFDISFKIGNEWQEWEPVDLGTSLDNNWIYCCPYMSPDGKYFFYSRRYQTPGKRGWEGVTKGEVYWIDSQVVLKNGPAK